MKRIAYSLLLVLCFALASCGQSVSDTGGAEAPTQVHESNTEAAISGGYEQISAQEAKTLMDAEEVYTILDVRTQEEFDEGHIPGATLIPHDEIEASAEEMLPDKEQLTLVYCRSGRRSKIAAEALAKMGYTNVKEFGGINDWPYEVER